MEPHFNQSNIDSLLGHLAPGSMAHDLVSAVSGVTDMLILRKREKGEAPSGPAWMGTTTLPDPAGGDPIPVNEYFAAHPEQMLGKLDRTGTMYRGDQKNVSLTDIRRGHTTRSAYEDESRNR